MINMIKMEFYKLRRQKIFYIILLFVGVIAVMSSISAMSLNINLNGKTQYVEMFQDVSMLFACAIFVAMYIGNDFICGWYSLGSLGSQYSSPGCSLPALTVFSIRRS